VNGLVGRAALELGKMTAAGGPEKDPAGNHHKVEIRAVLRRAKNLADNLPTKLRIDAVRRIEQLADAAGVSL
jgi:hypothetical protein